MCHRHVKVRSPDGEEPPDDAEQEMETPDRSKDDEFEGVSPAEQMKLRGALRGQAKRGRKKGHLKRKNSIRRARSQTEPEESEEKLELPPSKKPRAKSSGAGPELRDLPPELPSTTRARESAGCQSQGRSRRGHDEAQAGTPAQG